MLGPYCSPHFCHTNAAGPTLPRCPFPLPPPGTGEIWEAETPGNTKPSLCPVPTHSGMCFILLALQSPGRVGRRNWRPDPAAYSPLMTVMFFIWLPV